MNAQATVRTCVGCACDDDHACPDGCYWATETVCTTCWEAREALLAVERPLKGTRARDLSIVQLAMRGIDRGLGPDFADLIVRLAAEFAIGDVAAADAILEAQASAATARDRGLVRPSRREIVVREAKRLATLARGRVR